MKERWNRLLAFALDALLVFAPLLVVTALAALRETNFLRILQLPLLGAGVALLISRDRLFKGASPGKRLFGFRVYNKKTLKPAAMGPCGVRNFFVFLLPLDLAMLLSTGETLGDRAAGTIVLSEQSLAEYRIAREEGRSPEDKLKGKHIALIAGAMALWMLCAIGFIQLGLQSKKKTEEYALAYDFLVNSETWKQLGAEESRIQLNQYSISTNYTSATDKTVKIARLGFQVKGDHFLQKTETFQVVCQWEDGAWKVVALYANVD